MFTRPKKYMELFIQKDRTYFVGNTIVEDIREVFRDNPELVNVKIKIEFFAKRCSACNKSLTPAMCYENQGRTICGTCKGAKNDFNENQARRFQI